MRAQYTAGFRGRARHVTTWKNTRVAVACPAGPINGEERLPVRSRDDDRDASRRELLRRRRGVFERSRRAQEPKARSVGAQASSTMLVTTSPSFLPSIPSPSAFSRVSIALSLLPPTSAPFSNDRQRGLRPPG